MKIYSKRLVKGLLYAGIGLFVIFHEFGTNWLGSDNRWRESVSKWAENQSDFVSGTSSFVMFILIFSALILLIKGVYYLYTMNVETVPALDTSLAAKFSKPCSGYDDGGDNIEKMKAYRDSKMGVMMNSDGVNEYKKTAWVDSLTADKGKHTQSVKRLINSELASKTNEQGYEWLKK